jgi:hypothetical protein
MPKITPTPKTKMKIKPNSTEDTVVKVTSIIAALPPSSCSAPIKADLCKCVCLESVEFSLIVFCI